MRRTFIVALAFLVLLIGMFKWNVTKDVENSIIGHWKVEFKRIAMEGSKDYTNNNTPPMEGYITNTGKLVIVHDKGSTLEYNFKVVEKSADGSWIMVETSQDNYKMPRKWVFGKKYTEFTEIISFKDIAKSPTIDSVDYSDLQLKKITESYNGTLEFSWTYIDNKKWKQ